MIEVVDLDTNEPLVLNLGREEDNPFRKVQAFVTVEGWVASEDGTLVVTFKQAGVIK